jgi:hypothetical protein
LACGHVTDANLCTFDYDRTLAGRQFSAILTPDAQLWPAYILNATNPGQYYYNAIVTGTPGNAGSVTMNIPWPFVTNGNIPVSLYDANTINVDQNLCFRDSSFRLPTNVLENYPATVTLADWANGAPKGGLGSDGHVYSVQCEKTIVALPNNLGYNCAVTVHFPIPASGQAWVNMRLDYGVTGSATDVNPNDTFADRYDKGPDMCVGDATYQDALVNDSNHPPQGALALEACSVYPFSHSGSGTGNDSVQNVNTFSVIGPPKIDDFNPKSGLIGSHVTITGSGFTGLLSVKFNLADAVFTLVDDTTIDAIVPAGAQDGQITVTTVGGTDTSVSAFDVLDPQLNSFAPKKGAVGTNVTISGANFTGATDVSFGGGVMATFNVATDTTITTVVPLGALTGKISVTTPGGTAVSAQTFEVKPQIDAFNPTSGLFGTAVTINGSGFTGTSGVAFAGTPASFVFVNDFTITTTVPSGAKDGKIKVTTAVGFTDSGSQFNVINPTITSFSPPKGVDGVSVTINGDDLGTTTAVSFNGTDAGPLPVVSAKKVDAVVPPGATTGKITLTTIAGPIVSANDFTIKPVITGVNPSSGPVGTQVTISGSGFTGVSSVTFKNTVATFVFVNDFTITATVPPGATTGKITVTTADGTAHSGIMFTVT